MVITVFEEHTGVDAIVNTPMFAVGLLIALIAAALLVLNVIESGIAALVGIIGIGLIAASARRTRSQQP